MSALDKPPSIRCGGESTFDVNLTSVSWLKDSGNTVRYFKVEKIKKYQLICPGDILIHRILMKKK